MTDRHPYIEGQRWAYVVFKRNFSSSPYYSQQPCCIWLDFTSQPSADFKMLISIFPPGYVDDRSPAVQWVNRYPMYWRIYKVVENTQYLSRLFRVTPFSIFERNNALIWDATPNEKKSSRYPQEAFKPTSEIQVATSRVRSLSCTPKAQFLHVVRVEPSFTLSGREL